MICISLTWYAYHDRDMHIMIMICISRSWYAYHVNDMHIISIYFLWYVYHYNDMHITTKNMHIIRVWYAYRPSTPDTHTKKCNDMMHILVNDMHIVDWWYCMHMYHRLHATCFYDMHITITICISCYDMHIVIMICLSCLTCFIRYVYHHNNMHIITNDMYITDAWYAY